MKIKYAGVLLLAGVLTASSQGTLTFNNDIPGQVVAPIYGPELGDPTVPKIGNTAAGFPSGTQVYTGPLLSGTGWSAQLLGGPIGQPESALVPLSPIVNFRTGTGAGYIVPTTFVPALPGATTATYQMVTWDNRSGTVNDWGQAQVLWSEGVIQAGKSPLYNGPTTGNTTFLRSFSLTLVPEPSLLAVLGGGVAVFLARRLRSRNPAHY